ncbi:DUF4328 domain-containing protein [Streptomyces sp. NPDC057291]|uniref:DUF4328 domain-containing protein n=1 Tax=Streptomyces sp. NPDC057291 TaxID=3346087 RepID=UPI00363A5F7D
MGKASSKPVCLAFGVNIAVAVALFLAQTRFYAALGAPQGHDLLAEMWVENLDGVLLAVFAGAGVLFLGWFTHARDQARRFRPPRAGADRSWSMIWWFIPVANLWMPFHAALGIWASSQPHEASRRRSRLTVIAWWVLFTAWTCTLGWAQRLHLQARGSGALRDALRVGMAASGLCVLAAIAATVFVVRLTQMQLIRAQSDAA